MAGDRDDKTPQSSPLGQRRIDQVIDAPAKPLTDQLEVRRALPKRGLREIGPFVFLDHIGPADYAPGEGLYVPPHPHAGLQTVTYLFEGGILHKDSLGTIQEIQPGDMNWMTAGCGIEHSEETPEHLKAIGHRLHGIQIWVALPQNKKAIDPDFKTYDAGLFSETEVSRARCRLLCGEWQGLVSPVETYWPTFYLDILLEGADDFILPVPETYALGAYIVDGAVRLGEDQDILSVGKLAHFLPGSDKLRISSDKSARFILVGGEPLQETTVIFENFVLNSMEEIRAAQADYAAGLFGSVKEATNS